MRPERGGSHPPLSLCRRVDTVAVCAGAGITPREDPHQPLDAVRAQPHPPPVLPELAKLNRSITSAIARRGRGRCGHGHLGEPRGSDPRGGRWEDVALAAFQSDGDFRTSALALWWERHTGQQLGARHRAALAHLAASTDGSRSLDLPGGRALREYSTLRVAARDRGMAATDKKLIRDGAITIEPGRSAEWHGWRFAIDMPIDENADVAHLDTDPSLSAAAAGAA